MRFHCQTKAGIGAFDLFPIIGVQYLSLQGVRGCQVADQNECLETNGIDLLSPTTIELLIETEEYSWVSSNLG